MCSDKDFVRRELLWHGGCIREVPFATADIKPEMARGVFDGICQMVALPLTI